MVGLSRRERVLRLPRDRVQRHSRGGGAHRRLSALQVPRLRARRHAARRPRDHAGREQARSSDASTTRPGATRTAAWSTTGPSPAWRSRAYRWTAADSSLRWLRMNARGLDVEIEDVTERISALAVQGPLSRDVLGAATETTWGDLRYFGRRAAQVGGIPVDVSRTGYTGDLGYEVWVESARAVELWDAFVRAGSAYGIRPAGMLALDIARVEAGLILIEVDFDSVRRALIPEQSYSPFELGILGHFVDFEKPVEFVGRRALEREQERGGPPRQARRAGARVGAARGAVPREGADADPGARGLARPRSSVRAGAADRQGHQHDVEPDPEEGGCAGVGRRGPEHARHEDRGRVDGGGAAQPGAGDGRRAPVLQPGAQDLLVTRERSARRASRRRASRGGAGSAA